MIKFLFFQKNVKETVAIKIIERNKLSKKEEDNVATEINMMIDLQHKNIVKMIDFTWGAKSIHMILEHCNGGDLSMYIKRYPKMSEKLCCLFMKQLALALQFMRSLHICHFDLKPQNLFLTETPYRILKLGG